MNSIEESIQEIYKLYDEINNKKLYAKTYYQLNKDKLKQYYLNNKQTAIERAKQSKIRIRAEDPEKYKEQKKLWNKSAYETKKQKLLFKKNK
jgi:hypothetical protein